MKQKLTNSAISLWYEKGYDSVSISEICRSCGVTTDGSGTGSGSDRIDAILGRIRTGI